MEWLPLAKEIKEDFKEQETSFSTNRLTNVPKGTCTVKQAPHSLWSLLSAEGYITPEPQEEG